MSRTFDPGVRKLSSEEITCAEVSRRWARGEYEPRTEMLDMAVMLQGQITALREELRMLREYVLGGKA